MHLERIYSKISFQLTFEVEQKKKGEAKVDGVGGGGGGGGGVGGGQRSWNWIAADNRAPRASPLDVLSSPKCSQ